MHGILLCSFCLAWNSLPELISGGVGIRMSWVENFLKINKRGGTSIRDQRVTGQNLPRNVSNISLFKTLKLFHCLLLTNNKSPEAVIIETSFHGVLLHLGMLFKRCRNRKAEFEFEKQQTGSTISLCSLALIYR